MKSRQEMKALAKDAMRQQRGTSIVTILLLLLVVTAIVLVGFMFTLVNVGLGMLIIYGGLFFIGLPLEVNAEGIFIKIWNREKTSANELFSNLNVNLLRKVGGMLWMILWVSLWSLLLWIPGIVKAYAYSFTPLILADCPNVTARDALKLSMRMTNGHKMKLFVLSLSFIGWFILSAFTFYILAVVFVFPYYYAAYAGYYVELRDKALADGTITREELYGKLQ